MQKTQLETKHIFLGLQHQKSLEAANIKKLIHWTIHLPSLSNQGPSGPLPCNVSGGGAERLSIQSTNYRKLSQSAVLNSHQWISTQKNKQITKQESQE